MGVFMLVPYELILERFLDWFHRVHGSIQQAVLLPYRRANMDLDLTSSLEIPTGGAVNPAQELRYPSVMPCLSECHPLVVVHSSLGSFSRT